MPTSVPISFDAIRRRSGVAGRGNNHGHDVVVTSRVLSRESGGMPRIGANCFKRSTTAAVFGACLDVRRALHRGPQAASVTIRTAAVASEVTRQLLDEAHSLPGARPIPTKRIQLGIRAL
jgi:hypothetical protein